MRKYALENGKAKLVRDFEFSLRIVPLLVGALVGRIKGVLREIGRVFSEVSETKPTITITVAEIKKQS